jgi:hypothetical protein
MRPALLLATLALAGCNLLGGDEAEAIAARREADGKAIGGACRHAGRAIEDCYTLNRRADKSAVYAGWREMNDYMRENKIEPVAPQLSAESAVAHAPDGSGDGKKAARSADRSGDKAAEKGPSKSGGKGENAKGGDRSGDKPADKSGDKAAEKVSDKTRPNEAHGTAGGSGNGES